MSKKIISRRALAWLLVILTVAAIIPMLVIALYNHPYCDDYNFSTLTRNTWVQTGSFSQTVKAAVEVTLDKYFNWQGCYTASFLTALQPAIFSENLYFLITFVLVGMLVFSLCYVVKFFARDMLGIDTAGTVIIASLCVLLATQLVPDAGESFYWCNGGFAYTLMQSLLLIAVGILLRLEKTVSVGKTVVLSILLAILLFMVGGGNFSTGLFGCVVFFLATVYAFVKKSRKSWLYAVQLLILTVSFAINVFAPGNSVRMAVTTTMLPPLRSILGSLLYTGMFVGKWTDLTLLGAAGLCVPLFIEAAKKKQFAYPRPLLVTGLAYCVFATFLTPPLYGGAYVGGGRQISIYYFTYIPMFLACVYYWVGYFVKKKALPEHSEIGKGYRTPVCVALCVCMLLGAMGFDRGETTQFGLRTVTGGSALRSILNGEAQRFDAAMSAREKLLLDSTQPNVSLTPISEAPDVLIKDLLYGEVPDYAPEMIAEYYGKESVSIAEDEQ